MGGPLHHVGVFCLNIDRRLGHPAKDHIIGKVGAEASDFFDMPIGKSLFTRRPTRRTNPGQITDRMGQKLNRVMALRRALRINQRRCRNQQPVNIFRQLPILNVTA